MISRRRHERELTEARRTYREAYERDTAAVLAKEARVDALLGSLLRAKLDRETHDGLIRFRLAVDVSPRLLEHTNMYELVARRIVEGLAGLHADRRPDMRRQDQQRRIIGYQGG